MQVEWSFTIEMDYSDLFIHIFLFFWKLVLELNLNHIIYWIKDKLSALLLLSTYNASRVIFYSN